MNARIFNASLWVEETDARYLKATLDTLLNQSGFTILAAPEHNFEPYGYTALWLLSESHCAVHTFPEERKAYIEISSCNKDFFDRFIEAVKDTFKIRTWCKEP